MRVMTLLLLTIIVFGGCDDAQSPNVRFVDDMEVSLYHISEVTDYPWRLDNWYVYDDEEGQDLALFAEHWQQNMTDIDYDLKYDATQDLRTDANDLTEFVKNWLEVRQ